MRPVVALLLASCVSKSKYAALEGDQEELYQRMDGMTAAMNGMSADLVAAKDAEKAAIDELARARAAIEGEGGKVADLSERLAELAAVEEREAERATRVAAADARHAAIVAALEPLASARVLTVLRDGASTVVELPAALVLDGESVNDAGRKALGAIVDAMGASEEPVAVRVALDGQDVWAASAKAAASAAAAVVAAGVPAARVVAVGLGPEKAPLEGARAGPKRVELCIGLDP